MSLINEALKKAQALQDAKHSDPGKAVAGGAEGMGEPSMRPRVSAGGTRLRGSAAGLLAGAVLCTLLVIGIGFAVHKLSTPAETPTEIAFADPSRPVPRPPEDAVETVSPVAEPVREDPAPTIPAADPPTRTPAAEDGSSPQPSTAAGQGAESAPAPSGPGAATIPAETIPAQDAKPEAPPPPAPVPEEEILAIIDLLEIRGIMADSKRVLIYDSRVKRSFAYGIGSTVSRTPLLKTKEITPQSITFTDEAGRSFTKAF